MVGAPLPDPGFWAGKRVLVTGHTGFKGSWMALWLERMGAEVVGLALAPETSPNLFEAVSPITGMDSHIVDLSDEAGLNAVVKGSKVDLAIHMAAQPLVRRSYREPIETFRANALGTALLLEALRSVDTLKAALMITTDKVYRNLDDGRDFLETDPLGGFDPYSASKAAAEMAIASWAASFFAPKGIPVASARGGNVIGGGDWSEDRLVPDLWRAKQNREAVVLRNPNSTRPWQHVLDAVAGYLLFVEALAQRGDETPRALNFGPPAGDTLTVGEVATSMVAALGSNQGWRHDASEQPHEMKLLSLDPTLAMNTIGWRPRLAGPDALAWSASWYKAFDEGQDPKGLVGEQIERYLTLPPAF